mgnify:CR=1 FL=1
MPEFDLPISGVGYVGVLAVLAALFAAVFAFISWRRHLASLTAIEIEA